MRVSRLFAPSIVGLVASSPVMAIDCGSAGHGIEGLICSDNELTEADAALDDAYTAILRKAPDAEIRSMLVESERRWSVARNIGFERIVATREDDPDGPPSRDIVLEVIRDRVAELIAKDSDGTPTLVQEALSQRRFAAQFSSGPFAGYETNCDLLPPDNVYACFSTRHYQNGNRICSVDEYWASGSVYTSRYVAELSEGRPKIIAACSFNGNDACPGNGVKGARWNTEPSEKADLYPRKVLLKVDAEVFDRDDRGWLKTCLTDRSFPLAEPE